MSILGDRLKTLRGSSSQTEMAEALGMKYQQYARYEKGVTVPGADVIAQICTVHACSADWLLGVDRSDSAADKQTKKVVTEKDCEACPFKQLALAFQASAAKLPRK